MSKTDAPAKAASAATDSTHASPFAAGAAPAAATAKAVPLTGVALGIDVGGTGTKAAMIDLATAELVTARYREKTPQPSEPAAVIETIASVVAPCSTSTVRSRTCLSAAACRDRSSTGA